jgi:hypothetical protein
MNRIDHIVINTRDRIDQVLACFERMGFIVTPRGYHTVGSINHTIVFKTDYLELLGYPEDKQPEHRPELVQAPAGLMATVLKAHDADQVRATLMTRGLTPRPVFNFVATYRFRKWQNRRCRISRGVSGALCYPRYLFVLLSAYHTGIRLASCMADTHKWLYLHDST